MIDEDDFDVAHGEEDTGYVESPSEARKIKLGRGSSGGSSAKKRVSPRRKHGRMRALPLCAGADIDEGT